MGQCSQVLGEWGGLGFGPPVCGFRPYGAPPGPSLLHPGPGAGGWIYWKWGFSVLPGNLGRPMLIWAGNGLVLGWDDGFRFGVRRVARDSVLPQPPRPRGEHRAGLLCPWGLRAGCHGPLHGGPPALPRMQPCGVTPPRRWTGSRPRGLPEGMLQVPGLARLDRRLRLVGIPVVCGQGPASSPGPPAPSCAACWAAPPYPSSASRFRDRCRDGG